MKLKTTFLILSLIVLQVSLKAQEKCLTELDLRELTTQNPLLASGIGNLDSYIQSVMPDETAKISSGQMNLIRIPVVVHVVYNPALPEENLSIEDIKSQIGILNENFRRNPATQGLTGSSEGVDAMIEFYLADIDPEGNASTGITRTASTQSPFYFQVSNGKDVTAVKYSALGGHDAWDTGLYLNIWICNLNYSTGVTYGYAQLPFYSGTPGDELYENASDGIVIDYKAFGSQGSKKYPGVDRARTATHQAGHWLGLRDSDKSKNYSLDYSANYMNSSPEQSTSSFTKDQVALMRAVLDGPRNLIVTRTRGILVKIDQKLSDSSSVGSIGMWNGTSFVPQSSLPAALNIKKGSSAVLQSDKEVYSNQKFHHWAGTAGSDIHQIINVDYNTGKSLTSQFEPAYEGITVKNNIEGTGLTAGTIGFKDPWLADYQDSSFGSNLTNQGMNAPVKEKTSPFNPSFTTPNNGDLHKGVFLNMTTSSGSYYSVKASQTEDILLKSDGKYHRFYFQNWSGTDVTFGNPSSGETPVTFTSPAASADAVLKGTHLSGDAKAFTGNGQRKFIMTPDGFLHLVYSSMGKIWYELSRDNGKSWILMNGGKPLDNGTSKLPSIDYLDNSVVISWQSMDNSGTSSIKLRTFTNVSGEYTSAAAEVITTQEPFSSDINPLIAWGNAGKTLLLWQTKGGLSYKYGQISQSQVSWLSSGVIPGSDSTAVNAALSSAKDASSLNIFNLAWQQGEMPYAKIFYMKLQFNELGVIDENALPFFLSIYANFNTNISPSIISLPGGQARMAWKGLNEIGSDWGEYYVVIANPDNPWYMQYLNKYAGQVYSPQISLGSDAYIVGWTEPNQGRYETVCSNSSGSIRLKSMPGVDARFIQINNGGLSSQMFVTGFNSENVNAPYSFMQSDAVGAPAVNKSAEPLSGRTVGLVKDGAQFYLTLGNIKSDGMNIHFKEAADYSKIKTYLETEPFMLNDNSQLSFAVRCGIKDSLAAAKVLTGSRYASFRVELVDDASGNVLGNYFDAKLSSTNIFRMKESLYNVSAEGIGNKLVRLKIVPDDNTGAEYFIADRSTGKEAALTQPVTSVNVNYSGGTKVKEYSLSQNYPNPFNPSTQISFQLPKGSKVTLKVYDMLGREAATLLDGYKEEGRYSIQFNAKDFPSGMYIYSLRAGEYTSIKKMMLIK
ncbi:MAG TPA: T9SS type A sorting domain-containing protein [Ignavibacteriales bacterium]|nr:T9SS type A sorting domain-containing protein [Ignavibacteriales bacterium]